MRDLHSDELHCITGAGIMVDLPANTPITAAMLDRKDPHTGVTSSVVLFAFAAGKKADEMIIPYYFEDQAGCFGDAWKSYQPGTYFVKTVTPLSI